MESSLFETTVGEVCQVFDGPHATPTRLDSGPVFLGITSLNKGRIDLAASDHVSEEDFAKWTRRVTPKPGDVVFSYETKLGEAAIIPEGLRCCLGRRMGLMRPDPKKLDSRYLLYYYLGPEFQDVIRERTIHGSTVERIALIEFPKFPLRIPPLAEQIAIAAVLGALDDKIELNRRMNATLEAMARALFQSWFVDFDPVRAKLDGRQPVGLDPATAALFPVSLEVSPLGTIPKGWKVKRISEVVEEVFDGPHATPPNAEEGPIFLGIKNLTGSSLDLSEIRHISESDWPRWTKRVTPRPFDIVFSYEATLGFFALIPPKLRCCLGRRLALIRPRPEDGHPHFWFHQFIGPDFQRYLMQHSVQGATVDRVPLIQFPNYLVLDPPPVLKRAFECRVAPLWRRIHANSNQSHTLATLRNTLLPKLLSGEKLIDQALL
jgi:type I restriction enzyme S subunit